MPAQAMGDLLDRRCHDGADFPIPQPGLAIATASRVHH
jgi:hypothetical protein